MFVIILLACLSCAMIYLLYDTGKKGMRDYTVFDDKPEESESHSATRYKDAE